MSTAPRIKQWRAGAAVVLLIAAYSIFFAALAVARHEAHQTSVFDLGVYDQAIWSTAQGQVLRYTAEPAFGENFLATHLQPVLILLAPLYWLWDDVRLLFLVQTLGLALGALPVYWLTRWKTQSAAAGVLLSAVYLLLPALEAANLFDFHPETFAPVLWLLLFCMLECMLPGDDKPVAITPRRARICFALSLVLILSVKEDMALLVAMLGLYIVLVRRRPKLGLSIVVLASLWFLVGVYIVMPYFHHGELSPFLTYYATLGSSPQQIAWTALTNPGLTASLLLSRENAIALLAFMLPLAFAPLLDLPLFLIAAPALLLNGLSDNPLMHLMEDKHYAAPIIPFALLATIYGLGRLRRWRDASSPGAARIVWGAVLFVFAFSLVYHYYRGFTPLSRLYQPVTLSLHDKAAAVLQAEIPPAASLVALDRLYPHLSHRTDISYVFPPQTGAEYIFLDVAHPLFVNANNIHSWLQQQVAQRTDYGVIDSRDGYILMQRGAPHADFAPAFFSFATGNAADITHPLVASFGAELELEGFNVITTRDRELSFETYWRTLKAQVPDRLPNLYLLDTTGKSIGETRFAQPGLVWYPSSQWQPGQLVRLVFNTITWTTEDLERYTVALSVLDRPDPNNAKRALIAQSADSARLLHNASMVRLGDFRRQFGYTWLDN